MQDEWKTLAKVSKDVQYEMPELNLPIKYVGINGFRLPISNFSTDVIKYGGAIVRATVDLPKKMRGANMSRTAIGIIESVSEAKRIEDLASIMARKLLAAHEYSVSSRVSLRGEGFLYTESPVTSLNSIERFVILERATKMKDNFERNVLGVRVIGISTCPCGAELMKAKLGSQAGAITPTHMQRVNLSILVEFNGQVPITVKDLIDIAYRSMSGSVYSTLKRADEAFVIYNSLANTKFVEDIYRSASNAVYLKLSGVKNATAVYARAESYESIHGYNAIASGWISMERISKAIASH